jgi:hypothetical protein
MILLTYVTALKQNASVFEVGHLLSTQTEQEKCRRLPPENIKI